MAKNKYKIPFDTCGNLLNYVIGDHYYDAALMNYCPVNWEENYIFEDELEYYNFSHGRSSTQMYFRSLKNWRKYNMSLGDFSRSILEGLLVNKIIKCNFTFAKRGAHYMLTPVFPKNK